MPEATAVHDLSPLTWLGVKLYASEIETSWSQRLAPRVFPYVDGEAHERTGRAALEVSATLHFLNTIEPGMYPRKFNEFLSLLLNGEGGTLGHPNIGKFNARNADGSYTITASTTAGVKLRVRWVESIKSADEPSKIVPSTSDVASTARRLDDAMEQLGRSYPDGMADSGATFESLVNDIALLGFTFSLQLSGAINQLRGNVNAIYNAEQLLCRAAQNLDDAARDAIAGDPLRWVIETSCDSMLAQLDEMEKSTVSGSRAVKTTTAGNDTSLAALSISLDADIADLINLNPSLCGKILIERGTLVKYFEAA